MSLVDTVSWRENDTGGDIKAGTISVHKFGGSSLQDADAISRVVTIIAQKCGPSDIVVLSAMGKTTDLLINLVEQSRSRSQRAGTTPEIDEVRAYQLAIIDDVLPQKKATLLGCELESDLQRIEFLLSHIDDGQFNSADIIGYGELWSTRLVCAALLERKINCYRADPRDFIYTNDIDSDLIDWQKSQLLFDRCKSDFKEALVVTCGYIASDSHGNTVTLGRNGSDFSATIVAKLTKAKMVHLWTDVNGVFSGDPKMITDTKVIPVLGVHEANSIARLGTSVFHEKTLGPLRQFQIPIYIGNCKIALTETDNSNGTLIMPKGEIQSGAKTVAYKQSVCLFKIKWQTAALFEHLSANLKRLLTQNSIPHYCWNDIGGELKFCVLSENHTQVAKLLTRKEVGEGCEFSVDNDLTIISIVGHELLSHGEHLSKYYSHIERSKNRIYLHHYDGEGAVSTVLKNNKPLNLVRDIHADIFVANTRQISSEQNQVYVAIYGCGNIGRELLRILERRLEVINSRVSQKIIVVAICNSRHFIFNESGINLNSADELLTLKDKDSINSVRNLEGHLDGIKQGRVCIVDVTASGDVSANYGHHFIKGRHIISASKLALTLPRENYNRLESLAQTNDCQWLSNVSCGAGLPIAQCISDLALSGDKLKSIEGVLSGSLSWILTQFDGTKSFSKVVREAKALGLTEPDPRDDLSGKDVQRKLLIIARTLGISLDLDKIQLSPLIPAKYFELDEQAFSQCDDEIDLFMKDKWKHAKEQGMKLCYGAEIKFGRERENLSLLEASVGLSFRSITDSMVGISAADNIVVIRSDWHNDNPLIIRGPGAGIEVTAAGIISDLVRLCR